MMKTGKRARLDRHADQLGTGGSGLPTATPAAIPAKTTNAGPISAAAYHTSGTRQRNNDPSKTVTPRVPASRYAIPSAASVGERPPRNSTASRTIGSASTSPAASATNPHMAYATTYVMTKNGPTDDVVPGFAPDHHRRDDSRRTMALLVMARLLTRGSPTMRGAVEQTLEDATQPCQPEV